MLQVACTGEAHELLGRIQYLVLHWPEISVSQRSGLRKAMLVPLEL